MATIGKASGKKKSQGRRRHGTGDRRRMRTNRASIDRPFEGFGPSWLCPGVTLTSSEVLLACDDAGCRHSIRAECPTTPGVYGMVDPDGMLIYVGKSKSLRDRLVSYFTPGPPDSKARRIVSKTKRIVWESAPHEFTALLRELELIRRWSPRFNVKGRPDHFHRAYVAIGRGAAPCVRVVGLPSAHEALTLGPLPPGRDLARQVRLLNDWFQLRDCPERTPIAFSDQKELFDIDRPAKCLRAELGACLAPCAGGCSRRKYQSRVRAAREFLQGTDLSPLDRLRDQMRQAAAVEQFERAGSLRDLAADLDELHQQLERLKEVRRRYSFVYPLPGYRKGGDWYLVHRGEVAAVVPAPQQARAAKSCLRSLEELFPISPQGVTPRSEDPDIVLLVTAWFRAHPEELDQTLTPQEAKGHCLLALPAA